MDETRLSANETVDVNMLRFGERRREIILLDTAAILEHCYIKQAK